MSYKLLSIVLIVIGVLFLAVSLLADVIGLGHHPGLGLYQLAGTSLGLVIAIIGILFFKRKS